jgi:large-conductance mechanosensitive channel
MNRIRKQEEKKEEKTQKAALSKDQALLTEIRDLLKKQK